MGEEPTEDLNSKTLDWWLEKWANDVGVPKMKDKWKDELLDQGIGNMQALEKRARQHDSWEDLCAAVTGGIREELRDWKRNVYHKENAQCKKFLR
jgi:hypothetical protein